jgi:hypothetical protein
MLPANESRSPFPFSHPPTMSFHTPLRHIFDAGDLKAWNQSSTCDELLKFVSTLNSAVANKAISAHVDVSASVMMLVSVLGELEKLVDAVPPLTQSMRYGNKAFRDWHGRVVEHASAFMQRVLAGSHAGGERELVTYFVDSFGNATRIDYGTGHETTFVILLCER